MWLVHWVRWPKLRSTQKKSDRRMAYHHSSPFWRRRTHPSWLTPQRRLGTVQKIWKTWRKWIYYGIPIRAHLYGTYTKRHIVNPSPCCTHWHMQKLLNPTLLPLCVHTIWMDFHCHTNLIVIAYSSTRVNISATLVTMVKGKDKRLISYSRT